MGQLAKLNGHLAIRHSVGAYKGRICREYGIESPTLAQAVVLEQAAREYVRLRSETLTDQEQRDVLRLVTHYLRQLRRLRGAVPPRPST